MVCAYLLTQPPAVFITSVMVYVPAWVKVFLKSIGLGVVNFSAMLSLIYQVLLIILSFLPLLKLPGKDPLLFTNTVNTSL